MIKQENKLMREIKWHMASILRFSFFAPFILPAISELIK